MRRAKQREMENQAQSQSQMGNSHFFHKLVQIPVVKFGVDQASNMYGKVKEMNTLTHKSFELAEIMTGAVVCRVTPLAQRGMSIAAPSLNRIDMTATHVLESLEQKVPAINTPPENVISEVKEAVKDTVVATKKRVTKASESVLVSKPVQTYFDLVEFFLGISEKTLDKVLPPTEGAGEPVDKKTAENYPGVDEQAERGWYLMGQYFSLLGTAKDRLLKRLWTRVDNTKSAVDQVYNQAKSAMNNTIASTIELEKSLANNGAAAVSDLKTAVTSTVSSGGKQGKKNKKEDQQNNQ